MNDIATITATEKAVISHAEIINREGGSTAFGQRIDEDANNVKGWKRTDSIPAAHWNRIVDAGLASFRELADAAAARRAA